jgi:hypothetical protein
MPTLEVFDDIIDKPLQEKIKSTLMNNFPWYFISDVTSSESENQGRPSFVHLFSENYKENSDFYWMPKEIVSKVILKFQLKITQIIQSRTFFQLPLSSQYLKNDTVDNAHVDLSSPHLVVLYYVMDSDGDTIIYDKKWEKGKENLNSQETAKLLIKKRVTPKQGRLVVFDGRYWHTAEQPKYNKRCVINTDITYEGINANI